MTIEQLRTTLRANPFQPFTVRMADGRQFPIPHPDFLTQARPPDLPGSTPNRQFPIPHPDFLTMSPSGRTAVIFHPDDSASIVDLLLMTELELSPPSRARA